MSDAVAGSAEGLTADAIAGSRLAGLLAARAGSTGGITVPIPTRRIGFNVGGRPLVVPGGLSINSPEQRRLRSVIAMSCPQDWLGDRRRSTARGPLARTKGMLRRLRGGEAQALRAQAEDLSAGGWAELVVVTTRVRQPAPCFHITWGTGPALVDYSCVS